MMFPVLLAILLLCLKKGSSLDAQNIHTIKSPRDNSLDPPLVAFPTNTPFSLGGSERVKAEERQCLFTFNIYASTIHLPTLSGRGCYYTQEFTAKQQQKPERPPQDHAPLLLHWSILLSQSVQLYPFHIENFKRPIHEQLEVIGINGICRHSPVTVLFFVSRHQQWTLCPLSTSLWTALMTEQETATRGSRYTRERPPSSDIMGKKSK